MGLATVDYTLVIFGMNRTGTGIGLGFFSVLLFSNSSLREETVSDTLFDTESVIMTLDSSVFYLYGILSGVLS